MKTMLLYKIRTGLFFTTLFFIIACKKSGNGPLPTAGFTFTGGTCNPACMVKFTNTSTNATDYKWDFGDGTTSTETDPTKTYGNAGTYTVVLTAIARSGSARDTKMIILQNPKPEVTVTPLSPFIIYLPTNCSNAFRITNSGPAGSVLNYTVNDNSPLGGFLSMNTVAGSLSSGNSSVINVKVDPRFVSGPPSLVGFTLPLDISTPDATNATHSYANFHISDITDEAQNFLGTWSGTWTGNSFGAANPGQPAPTKPVSGTWSLNIQNINTSNNTISGTLTWNGNDAYWTYTFDGNGNITSATPQTFNANRTISINSSNSSYQLPVPGGACDRFRLVLNDILGSAYGIYGPRLLFDMDLQANTVTSGGSSFTAWPYAPVYVNNLSSNQSNGSLSGGK